MMQDISSYRHVEADALVYPLNMPTATITHLTSLSGFRAIGSHRYLTSLNGGNSYSVLWCRRRVTILKSNLSVRSEMGDTTP